MSGCRTLIRPLSRQLAQKCVIRTFTRSAALTSETATTTKTTTTTTTTDSTTKTTRPKPSRPPPPPPTPADLDPNSVPREYEDHLMGQGVAPIGSRRRREAIRTTGSLPFEQLPYQAFQEARKVLAADREQKLVALAAVADKIAVLENQDAATAAKFRGGETMRQIRLRSLRREAHRLTILADINDPQVKRRFEDGLGDMSKPIYRHLAEKKWRAYAYKLIMQRIEQFNIVPDLLPKFDPVMDVQLYFGASKIPPGGFIASNVSERPPRVRAQAFDDSGERRVTVVVVDADVPDLVSNSFSKRLLYAAANLPLSPSLPTLSLPLITASTTATTTTAAATTDAAAFAAAVTEKAVDKGNNSTLDDVDTTANADCLAVPWSPPWAASGSPYHRICVFVLEQTGDTPVDVARVRELYAASDAARDGFSLKSFRDRFALRPVGFSLFRSAWDEHTAAVTARHGIEGADMELRPQRVYSLRPPRRPRGWEVKHLGPKYRHLDKYTKRIRGLSNAKAWVKRH